ncbi:hypothetical protein BD769DRAFT_1096175 [Suillus cothurnatus]|nr:hypothetical protein BD769DRAFT_1096175 [Suillus cothurnatus]
MMIRPLTDAFHNTIHAMREIIDSQTAASFQNYAGTHFWNMQESYLITMFEPIIRHDLSFEKGRSFQNQPILCPHFFCIRPEVYAFVGSLIFYRLSCKLRDTRKNVPS